MDHKCYVENEKLRIFCLKGYSNLKLSSKIFLNSLKKEKHCNSENIEDFRKVQ